MKKFFISLLSVVIGGAVVMLIFISLATEEGAKYVYKGNSDKKPIIIKPKEYQCSECNMYIDNMKYLAEIIREDGVTYFFDDIGCVVLWLKNNSSSNMIVITKTMDTNIWIDPKKAWYSKIDNEPMGYGFVSYQNKKDGFISYDEMKLLMLQGKTLHDPFVRKSLLGK